jgi:hypothetical protein
MDGKIVKKESAGMWKGGKDPRLNFEVELSEGNHVMEVFGADLCCDGMTSWKLKVRDETWMDFSTKNFDSYKKCMKTAEFKTCAKAPEKPKCDRDEFQCANGQCIDKAQLCDRKSQCADNSDEDFEDCCAGKFPAYDLNLCSGGTGNEKVCKTVIRKR